MNDEVKDVVVETAEEIGTFGKAAAIVGTAVGVVLALDGLYHVGKKVLTWGKAKATDAKVKIAAKKADKAGAQSEE